MKNGVEIQKNILLIKSMWSLEKINKINKSIVLFKEEKKIMDGKKGKTIQRGDLKKISMTAINLKTCN